MLRTRTALVGLVLCALPLVALTACASSPSSPAASSSSAKSSGSGSSSATLARPTDMCTLITAAQVASIVGGDAGDTYSNSGTCVYSPEDLDLTLSPTEVNWATAISIAKVQYGTLTTVPGIGDQAVEAQGFIQVRKDNLVFSISQPDADGNTSASYRALAKIVVGNLK